MKRIIYIQMVFILICINSYAQEINHNTVLTGAGDSYLLTGAVIDWTFGEWVVETHTEEPYLEQGFLHAFDLFPDVTTSLAVHSSWQESEIWPNPASEYFRLKDDPGISDELLLIDAGGTFIRRWKTNGQGRLFDVAGIPSGPYQVLILNSGGIIGYTRISIIH